MAKVIDGTKGKPRTFRRGLMLYGSTAAIAAALMLADGGVGPALAQTIGPRISPSVSAQGDFSLPAPAPSGSGIPAAGFGSRSPTLDIVDVNRDVVLNWTTYDTASPGGAQGNSYVNFLPENTELRFVGNGSNYTVVNRVLTTPDAGGAYRGIAFQGAVTSYLFNDGPVGGNIWFYSPGGILAAGTSSFNVGSLLLSASDLDNFIEYGSARSVDFTGVADPFASVILQPGARVQLEEQSSNFTIVAPTIEQGGDVFVNGSVLYLSAEEGNLYFGSFGENFPSITVQSQVGNRITHTGRTTGPSTMMTDAFENYDPQTIEFRSGRDVGVLLSGTIGYEAATNAVLADNGSIVLSVGSVGNSGSLTLTSRTVIDAEDVDLTFGANESLSMGGDANGGYNLFVNATNARIEAGAGSTIDIGGSLELRSFDQGGTLTVEAVGDGNGGPGGQVTVGGDLSLFATTGVGFNAGARKGGTLRVTIGQQAGIDVEGSMRLVADALGAPDDAGRTFAEGGLAAVDLIGEQANLRVGGELYLSAQARPFNENCECTPPPSGSALGGFAGLTVADGGIISAQFVTVTTAAEAYTSYYNIEGHDLSANGGQSLVLLGNNVDATFASVQISANATGATANDGTPGGAAIGGDAAFEVGTGGSLFMEGISVSADAFGGSGSDVYSDSQPGGRGGDADGGVASITLGQTARGLTYLDLSARAEAGQGGNVVEAASASGGAGGDARGGGAVLTLSGTGNSLAGVVEGSINVAAIGGEGGNGGDDFFSDASGGDGGAGGRASGGLVDIGVQDNAVFAWQLGFGTSSTGGAGGIGGTDAPGEGGSFTPGVGGRGGDASGAVVLLRAAGGTITGDLDIDATGTRGSGGANGDDGTAEGPGEFGYADSGQTEGGLISLRASGAGGRFDVGTASLDASGDVAGQIQIVAASPTNFDTLIARSLGVTSGPLPAFLLSAEDSSVSVANGVEISANDIRLDFARSGQLVVGGATTLSAGTGGVTITHADNTGVASIQSTGLFTVGSDSDYTAALGSIVASSEEVSVRALGSIFAADTSGRGLVLLSAQGDATVGNVSVTGSGSFYPSFQLKAGRIEGDGFSAYLPNARATLLGNVTSAGEVFVESGGFAQFAGTSSILADDVVYVRTGDDIIIEAGARLVSDISPTGTATTYLLAGDINLGSFDGDLVSPITTPIASLIIDGALDTNGHGLFLRADVIDGTGSTLRVGDLTVDITDAPVDGPLSNDNNPQLACLQGSVCLGTITATGNVSVGQDSDVISLLTDQIIFSGDSFRVSTRDQIALGGGSGLSELIAAQQIDLQSSAGAVALNNMLLRAPELRIAAPGDLSANTSQLSSPNAITLQIGGNIAVGIVDAGGGLTDGSSEPGFAAAGNFSVGELTYGAGTDILISAQGDLSIGTADAAAGDIALTAGNSLHLGSTALDTGAISLTGQAVSFSDLRSTGSIVISGGAGGITGLSDAVPLLDAAGAVTLTSAADVSIGDVRADGAIAISGGNIAARSLTTSDSLSISAGGSVSVASFDVAIQAAFTGSSLDLGTGSAGADITANAEGGSIAFTSLSGGGDGTLNAGAAIVGGDASFAGTLEVEGGSVAVGNLSASELSLITTGTAMFTSLTSTGGSLQVSADGDVTGGNLSAATSASLTGANVVVGDITAGTDLNLTAGALNAGSLLADGAIALNIDRAALADQVSAGTTLTMQAGTLAAGLLASESVLDVTVGGAASINAFESGGNTFLQAGSMTLGNGDVTGTLTASASGGALQFADLTVSGDASLAAAQALIGGDVAADQSLNLRGASIAIGNGSGTTGLAATTAGAASFGQLVSSSGSIIVDAGGSVSGGSARAAAAITVAGANVALGSAQFGSGLTLVARSGGLAGSGLYQGTGPVDLRAAQGIAIGSVDTLGGIAISSGDDARFAELRSRDGSLAVTTGGAIIGSSAAAIGSDPSGEDSVALAAGGAIALDGAVTVLNSASRAQDDFSARAGESIAIVRAEAGRDLSLDAGTGAVTANNIVVGRNLSLAGGSVGLTAGTVAGNLTVRATAGDVTGSGLTSAGGTVDVTASGSVAVGSLRANGGALSVTAGGAVSYTDLSAAGALSANAGGPISGRALTATGGLTVASGGGVAFSSVTAATADIDAGGAIQGGTVAVTGGATLDASDAIGLTGLTASNAALRATRGAVTATDLQVAGLLEANGTTVTLAAPGALRVDARASAGNVDITSGGDLRVNTTATGNIALASTGGSVLIGSVAQASGASGGIGTQAVGGGGAVSVTAANGIAVTDSLTAGGGLSMTAGGLVSLAGAASGQTIDLRASDLAIGTGGSLGTASTQRISLASSAPVNLGSGANSGFAVDAAEFARIVSGGDLMIAALGGTGPGAGSLTVGALTINAGSGGQVGASGTFGLTASGVLDVNSTLSIARASSGNTLMLTGDAVDLDYANAALSVMDNANVPTGRIVVNGRLITSLSSSAAADIVGKTPEQITLRLGQSDTTRQVGLFRAGNLTLEGRDAILIQNSGGTSADDRRGLSAGALTVTGRSDGSTLVIINGIVGSATGIEAAQDATITTPLAGGSSFNGCALANIAGCFAIPDPTAPLIEAPNSILFGTIDQIKDDEEDDEVEDGVADGKPEAPPIDTTRIDDPAGLPMIDDPVTGAGNEDLWQPLEPQGSN